MMSNDDNTGFNLDHRLITTDIIIDEPLIIVLDEDDDDDELDNSDSVSTTSSNNISVTCSNERAIISSKKRSDAAVQTPIEFLSNPKSKLFHRLSDSSHPSTKLTGPARTIIIDTNFVQPSTQRRTKSVSKRKSTNSILSYIAFDHISEILTVSRMGSIYYCLEDLYMKIFSSLCTFDEFISLLHKPEVVIIKSATLSERIAISEENPLLKPLNRFHYRLISIDSSGYLIKLKQLLLITNQNNKQIEKIIDQMRSYKQTSTSILLHNHIPTKHLSIDNDEQSKCLKSATNNQKSMNASPFEIFIRYDLFSTNKTSSDHSLKERFATEFDTNSSFSVENLAPPTSSIHRLYRSKSLIFNQEQIENRLLRSSSLPSIKFHIMLAGQSQTTDFIDDNCSMPRIINVEENVQIDPPRISDNLLSNPIDSFNQEQSSSCYLTPIQTPHNLCYPQPLSFYQKSKELLYRYHSEMTSTPLIMSLLERPIIPHSSTPEKQISTIPSYSPQPVTTEPFISGDIHPNNRVISQRHSSKSLSSIHQKHKYRISTSPYPIPLQNSPHLKLLLMPCQSVVLSQAILEHQCDIDKIPKLVVRHTKTYPNRTIDTMGQLFPTWFAEPGYHCIHCFGCDQVFTPQCFMTHVDDKQMINIRPLYMTSIELLTSEKLSEFKVRLWNQFCSNLILYAREGRIIGF